MFTTISVILGVLSTATTNPQSLTNIDILSVEYPPFTTETRHDLGISFTLLSPILKDAGYRANALIYPPARLNKIINFSDQWCVSMLSPVVITPDIVGFTFSQDPIPMYIYRHRPPNAQPFTAQELTQFSGQTIGLLRSIKQGELFKKITDAGINVYSTETITSAFKMLQKQRIDLIFSNSLSAQYYFSQFKIDPESIQRSSTPLFVSQYKLWLNLKCKQANALYQVIK